MYLLDSAATHSTVKSKEDLTNLTYCNKEDYLHTITNAGCIEFRQRGELTFLPIKPHYNEKSTANILALHELNSREDAYVVYKEDEEDEFYMMFKNGRMVKFKNATRDYTIMIPREAKKSV